MKFYNLLRRFGTWLRDWPCDHEKHEWGLFRPGTAMWWRSCKHCNLSDMAVQPPRKECDVDYYNNQYLPARLNQKIKIQHKP